MPTSNAKVGFVRVISEASLNWLNLDLRKVVRLFIALCIPLITIQFQKRPSPRDAWIDKPFSMMIAFVESGIFEIVEDIKNTTTLYINLVGIKKESQLLKDENMLLKAQALKLKELEIENSRLLNMVDFQAKSKMILTPAKVIGHDLVSDHSTIRINKGTHHGIKTGQSVISLNGTIGYTYRVQSFTSHVLLLTDRYSVVDAIVSRTRSRAIVEGNGAGSTTLQHIEKPLELKVGDVLVTSGLDNIFPKGFPIGHIESIETIPFSALPKVEVKPVIDPNNLEEIFVITNAAHENYMDTPEAPR